MRFFRDPFDRLIISQGIVEDIPIVTADIQFDEYQVNRVGNCYLAMQPGKGHPGTEVRVFLMADAAFCAIAGQDIPGGYFSMISGGAGRYPSDTRN